MAETNEDKEIVCLCKCEECRKGYHLLLLVESDKVTCCCQGE